jgi:hypothetical protein
MDENGLTITIESLLDCEVVALDGELDQQSAPELSEALTRAARNGKRVVVDLSELRFIDSSGLHVLMSGPGMEDGRRAVVAPPGTSRASSRSSGRTSRCTCTSTSTRRSTATPRSLSSWSGGGSASSGSSRASGFVPSSTDWRRGTG